MWKSVLLFVAVLLLPIAALLGGYSRGDSSLAGAKQASLTGLWRTAGPSAYLVVPSDERPQGKKVDHDDLDLVERHVQLEFQLTERPNGVLVGKNTWTAYDDDGKRLFGGDEPMLGGRDRDRAVLVETVDKENGTVQVVFELAADGPNKLVGIGYQTGSSELIAIKFELVRQGR